MVALFFHLFRDLVGQVVRVGARLAREFENPNVVERIILNKLRELVKLLFTSLQESRRSGWCG